MADSKISALSAVTVVGATDEAVLAIGGATKKITGANLKIAFGGPGTTNGQAGILVPTARGWVGAGDSWAANRVRLTRFCPAINFTVTSVVFRETTGGTGNVDFGIYDSTLTSKLKSSGSTSGKKGANTTQTVSLSSTLALTAGTVYYLAAVSDTSDGACTVASFTGIIEQLFGASEGLMESGYKDSTFPLAASLASPTANGGLGLVAALI